MNREKVLNKEHLLETLRKERENYQSLTDKMITAKEYSTNFSFIVKEHSTDLD